MKGLLLAGGNGTRLRPITEFLKKESVFVGDRPMIYYTFDDMVDSGIDHIIVRTNSDVLAKELHAYSSMKYSGHKFKLDFSIGVGPGVAAQIKEVRDLLKGDSFVVVFGDVLFENNSFFKEYLSRVSKGEIDSLLLLAEAEFPPRHATPIFEGDIVTNIIEKCQNPPHNLVVTTWDVFPEEALKYLDELELSARGELEISDLRNLVIKRHKVGYYKINGWWKDAGTPKDLLVTNNLVLERYFPEDCNYIGAGATLENSKVTKSSISGNYKLVNCNINNSIIMGTGVLVDQTIENTIIYNDIVLKAY